jgi:uncharacterized protein YkwD
MIARRRTTSQLIVLITASLLMAFAFVLSEAPAAHAAGNADESGFYDATNSYRGQNGLAGLQYDAAASNVARAWSQQMANAATLSHNPNLVDQINSQVTTQWTRLGENVGFGPTVDNIQNAFINSSAHRANILGDYNRVGIGTVRDSSGRIWVTLDFLKAPDLTSAPAAPSSALTPGVLTPATMSWGNARSDIFKRGGDGALWTKTWNGSSWTGWSSLGGVLSSEPATASWGSGRLDVFALGGDGAMWHKALNGGTWGGWESLGGFFTAGPGAVSSGANRIDVFGRGADGALWTKSLNGSSWSGWKSLGGYIASAPDAASWGGGRVDVFAVGGNGTMWHRSMNNNSGSWTGWEDLGGGFSSGPGAVSWGGNRIDIFARGLDGQMWGLAWTGQGWYGWYPMGGGFSSSPDTSAPAVNRLSVMACGNDGAVWQKVWNGLNWSGWMSLG